ncbi:hypothetical protein V491_06740 [Pseudogymnoascus sp. VKM F-3775]|nr:hypothetical protein V491_06740 [Pseudogymnoascus sp. VKM F-3775]
MPPHPRASPMRKTKSSHIMRRDRPLRRLTQACNYCRSRKIKCDLRSPSCANCENRSLPCQFSPQQRKRGPRPASEGDKGEAEYTHGGLSQSNPAPLPLPTPHLSQTQSDGSSPSHSYSASPSALGGTHITQYQSPTSSATIVTTPRPNQDSPLSQNIPRSQTPRATSELFAAIYHELDTAVGVLGLDMSMPSLARKCVYQYFDCLYPLMPIVYRPKIELGLCLLQPGIERREIDLQVFTLTVALCAIAAAIIPSTIFSEGALIADKFYHASKRSLELYSEIEQPTSSSIAIRYFQSGYTHSVGKPRTTWDELESAIAIAQDMRLHEEAAYAQMDEVESKLCRRLFWILFTGDKSAGILRSHHITLGRYLLESGITVRYSKSLEGEDSIVYQDSAEPLPPLIAGFNLNQDLWRAAYLVLLEIDSLRNRYLRLEDGETLVIGMPALAELSHLCDLYTSFETSLSNIPTCLSSVPTLSLSPESFYFGQENAKPPLARTFAVQRINLHLSYQCLRLVILQAMATLVNDGITIWHIPSPLWPNFLTRNISPGSGLRSSHLDPAPEHRISELCMRHSEMSTVLLQKVRIAEDMLYILHTSSLENLRLNGESCVEKIRLVGAAILEMIDHHADSPVTDMARRLKGLFPHILAHLESKASDSLAADA